jgi:hypothetical protein
MNYQSAENPLLWLNGIPGAGKLHLRRSLTSISRLPGKTILASLIIEEVAKLQGISQGYFYCRHNDPEKNTFSGVLRGLLAQLVQQDDDLLGYVYERCSSTSEANMESASVLKELVGISLKSSNFTFVILDGLDECKKGEAEKVVSWFTSMLPERPALDSGTFRLLCVSQRDGTLDKTLCRVPTISMENDEHQKDIESYARHWSSEIRQKFNITIDQEVDIAARVARSAAGRWFPFFFHCWPLQAEGETTGMFLFARLVLANLHSQTTKARLKIELEPGNFPEGLEEASVPSPTSPSHPRQS